MKRAIKLAVVMTLVVSSLLIAKTNADEYPTFGTAFTYGPTSQLTYPQAGDSYELDPGEEITLVSDGDLQYKLVYELDQDVFKELVIAGIDSSDNIMVQTAASLIKNMPTANAFSMLFNLTKDNNNYSTYAGLLDKHKYEFVGKLDEGLTPKKNSSGEYEVSFQSDYLEPIIDKIQYDSTTNEFVVPCKIKDNMKFTSKAPNYSVDDIQTILNALSESWVTATVSFESEDNYNSIKASRGKVHSTGLLRIILPNEIFPEHNTGAGTWMLNSYKSAYGEDAILTEGEGNNKRHYLEIQTGGGITTLLFPEPVINKANKYSLHTDGKAIFWLENDSSKTLSILYDIYDDSQHTTKTNTNTAVVWSVEMIGGFENYNFTSQMESFLPSANRQTTWLASSDTNSITLNSTKSGIYKVTVSLEGNSDYCYIVIPGDVNRDGHLQSNDAYTIYQYSTTETIPDIVVNDDFTTPLSDMNGDHHIQSNDFYTAYQLSLE